VNSRLLPDGIAPSGAWQVGGSEPQASGCGTTPHRPRLGAQGFARNFARTTRGGESWAPVKGRHALSVARLLESWTPEHLRRVTRRKPFARGARGVRGAHAKFPLKTEAAIRQFSLLPTVRGARIPAVSRCFTLMKRARGAKCATVHPDWQAERPPKPRSCPFYVVLCVSRGATCGGSNLSCARLHRTLDRTVHGLSFFVHSIPRPFAGRSFTRPSSRRTSRDRFS
jgi:hypothetical protein